jgi:hypothetical protein
MSTELEQFLGDFLAKQRAAEQGSTTVTPSRGWRCGRAPIR